MPLAYDSLRLMGERWSYSLLFSYILLGKFFVCKVTNKREKYKINVDLFEETQGFVLRFEIFIVILQNKYCLTNYKNK